MTIKPDKLHTHPAADLFPMLSKEELQELADDIKINGLREPIKLSADGKILLDGRNRLAACKLAKIEPIFAYIESVTTEEEVTAYIISQNLARRHLNPGQRAMVVAMIYPEGGKHGQGRGNKKDGPDLFPMVSQTSLKAARKVLRVAPDLAPNVLSGATFLENAYREARDREQLAESDDSKMRMLREQARDLANRVEEGMALNEAVAALQERKRKEIAIIEQGKQAVQTGLSRFLADVASIAIAMQLDDSILDKKQVSAVVKATEKLQALLK